MSLEDKLFRACSGAMLTSYTLEAYGAALPVVSDSALGSMCVGAGYYATLLCSIIITSYGVSGTIKDSIAEVGSLIFERNSWR